MTIFFNYRRIFWQKLKQNINRGIVENSLKGTNHFKKNLRLQVAPQTCKFVKTIVN